MSYCKLGSQRDTNVHCTCDVIIVLQTAFAHMYSTVILASLETKHYLCYMHSMLCNSLLYSYLFSAYIFLTEFLVCGFHCCHSAVFITTSILLPCPSHVLFISAVLEKRLCAQVLYPLFCSAVLHICKHSFQTAAKSGCCYLPLMFVYCTSQAQPPPSTCIVQVLL